LKKILIFGGGRIGRSFIGQLFSRAGYEVTFVDVDQALIRALKQAGKYKVVVKAKKEETIWVRNVKGIAAENTAEVVQAVAEADILAVSVGKTALEKVLPVIARGLEVRLQKFGDRPLDIILAENMRNAAEFCLEKLCEFIPEGYPVNNLVGMVETSIGKMVPLMTPRDLKEDPLQIFAEPYNTLILDRKGFRNLVPEVEGLEAKENMKAWVDRKSFIHNLGHAVLAYLGFLKNPQWEFTWEVLADPEMQREIKATMQQSSRALQKKYMEEFTLSQLDEHIDDLLFRFANRALGDTVFRVGLDLFRKLSPDDRLVGAIRICQEQNHPYDLILRALVAGTAFRKTDSGGNLYPRDQEFAVLADKGLETVLTQVCGFDPQSEKQVFEEANKQHTFLTNHYRNISI
jgi:mannitol-1-phosphate 5-dehydrogenase